MALCINTVSIYHVLLLSRGYLCSVSLPRGAVGWSLACD